MKFEIDTINKKIKLLEDIQFSDIEKIKTIIGKEWEEWIFESGKLEASCTYTWHPFRQTNFYTDSRPFDSPHRILNYRDGNYSINTGNQLLTKDKNFTLLNIQKQFAKNSYLFS